MRSTSPTPHEPGVWQKVLFRKNRQNLLYVHHDGHMVLLLYILLSLYARGGKGKKGDNKEGKKEMAR